MFGWLKKQPKQVECPLQDRAVEWIDSRWDWLIEVFTLDRLRKLEVVEPTERFFPERYEPNEAYTRILLDRLCDTMRIDPSTVELRFYSHSKPVEGSWQLTNGVYTETENGFRVWVETSVVEDPTLLVATLVHELCHVLLLGHGKITSEQEDHELITDLLTIFLGFGIFTANASLRESSWSDGTISGWSMQRSGYLGVLEIGYSLAKFADSRNEEMTSWDNHLRLNVRTVYRQSRDFLNQQRKGLI